MINILTCVYPSLHDTITAKILYSNSIAFPENWDLDEGFSDRHLTGSLRDKLIILTDFIERISYRMDKGIHAVHAWLFVFAIAEGSYFGE